MKKVEECMIGIVGLGLMGGAFALALRNCGAASPGRLFACDTDETVLQAALAEKLIDRGFTSPENMLPLCDLVFLCLNPSALLKLWEASAGLFKPGALITDIAGIKGAIAATVEHTLRPDLDFIPGHPMAGSEKGGFKNATFCHFQKRNYILTPLKTNRRENIEYLKSLIRRMGFGSVTETTPGDHDRKIAFTSQLCHVIAAALLDCEADTEITRFGGGSFEDLTRIAMLNAPMWTELFIENKAELLKRIEQFEKSLDELKELISAEASVELEQRLAVVRNRRVKMAG
jgi:prephenate dehydrogenase